MRRVRGVLFIGTGIGFLVIGMLGLLSQRDPRLLMPIIAGVPLIALGLFSFRGRPPRRKPLLRKRSGRSDP